MNVVEPVEAWCQEWKNVNHTTKKNPRPLNKRERFKQLKQAWKRRRKSGR